MNEHEQAIRDKYHFYHRDLIIHESRKGPQLKPTLNNISVALQHHPDFRKLQLTYSVFTRKLFGNGAPFSDAIISGWTTGLERVFQAPVSKTNVVSALNAVCHQHETNEPRDWFLALPETKKHDLLDTWLVKFCAAQDTKLNRALGRKWLLSVVARAMVPGAPIEGCLILQGPQRCGKSMTFRSLCPREDWFVDTNVNLGSDKLVGEIGQTGVLIWEFAELYALKLSTDGASKASITRTHDKYRPAYARMTIDAPRMQVFCGSTNDAEYLHDRTGNRRWWSVKVGKCDFAALGEVKEQLWSQALSAYRHNPHPTAWTLSDSEYAALEEINTDKLITSPLEDEIKAMLPSLPRRFPSSLLKEKHKFSDRDLREAANILPRLGYEKGDFRFPSGVLKGYEQTRAVKA